MKKNVLNISGIMAVAAIVVLMAGCDGTSSGSGADVATWTPGGTATPLTAGQWARGTISGYNYAWYSFNVSQGTTYRIWAENSVRFMAYYGNGTPVWEYTKDTTYDSPAGLNAYTSGTVYLQVDLNYGSSDTFSIVYNNTSFRPDPTSFTLAYDQWHDNTLNLPGDTHDYWFYANAGSTYYIWWNDRNNNPGGSKTAQVYISVLDSNGYPVSINSYGNGWAASLSFTASSSGAINIKASPYSTNTGTYAVAYTTYNSRPW